MAKTKTPKPTWVRDCELVRVVDGDTMWLRVEVGYYLRLDINVRLRGINCPEKNTKEGKAVMAYVQKMLPVGQKLIVETYHAPGDARGRWLGRIFKGDVCINDHLLEKKMAVPFMTDS